MRTLLFIAVFLSSLTLFSQSIDLPQYQQGKYENDTIVYFYGPLATSGTGIISLANNLQGNFVSGVTFKLIIDTTYQGSSPTHATFWDDQGNLVPIYKGDTLEISSSITIKQLSGVIGLYIIIEGVPSVSGESYLCDLWPMMTLGNNWDLSIVPFTNTTCTVDVATSINPVKENSHKSLVYPNPFESSTTITFDNPNHTNHSIIIYNSNGKMVREINNITSSSVIVEKDGLVPGVYFYHLLNKQDMHTLSGKLFLKN